jgi:hypothetical protein
MQQISWSKVSQTSTKNPSEREKQKNRKLKVTFSPIPWGQDKFNSTASAPAALALRTNSFQSSSLNAAMTLAIKICSGWSRLISLIDCNQYSWVFSEINSMFKNACWFGPKLPSWLVVPRTMRGDTFVTMSAAANRTSERVFVRS